MPILGAEKNVYPEYLVSDSGGEEFSRSAERKWWVLLTKPRQEKSLARRLLARQIPFYLPLIRKDNLIRGRRVRSHIPLFTGYVFFFGEEQERLAALETNRIAQMLPVPDQDELWTDLRQIERLLEADAPLSIERRLEPGREVRIKAGVMKGLEGTVVVRRSKSRLLVAVHLLQAGVSLEIDDYMLEPIN